MKLIQKLLIVLCISFQICLYSHLPVDVSFIVVDIKYNQERGAQICEIQHGILSAFRGYRMLYKGEDQIAHYFMNGLNGYFNKSWAMIHSFADPTIKTLMIESPGWVEITEFSKLEQNKEFLQAANLPVNDVSDLKSYHGFVFLSPNLKLDRELFRTKYPGVILIDNAFYHYADNKYKMTDLLMNHEATKKHKPKWGLYQKESPNVADQILDEIGSDRLVIKPTKEYLGRGVIILEAKDLKTTLEQLFRQNSFHDSSDPAYLYWKTNNSPDFIVEEFIEVEPVSFPHLDDKFYSPTLRLSYLLIAEKSMIHIHCVGCYYTLPRKALDEPGSLNERYKSCIRMPYFGKVDPALREAAEKDMDAVLRILYKQLLN